jgi:ribonuclease P/MRP protein subunit POP5
MVRIKERYLLVNIVYPPDPARAAKENLPDCLLHHQPTIDKLTPQALIKAIKAEAALLFGDYGSGAFASNLWGIVLGPSNFCSQCSSISSIVKYLSLATSTFILRCSRAHYQMLWSILTFMDHVPVKDGRPCIFRVVRVSGTIRKAEEEAIRQAKRLILAAKEGTSGAKSSLSSALQTQEQISLHITDDSSGEDEDMADADG